MRTPSSYQGVIMLNHLATYALPYLLAFAILFTGLCVWDDIRKGFVSNPFKK